MCEGYNRILYGLLVMISVRVHLFSKILFWQASWQNEPGELYGPGQFHKRNVVVVGFRLVFGVCEYRLHFMNSFIAVIHQHIKLPWTQMEV